MLNFKVTLLQYFLNVKYLFNLRHNRLKGKHRFNLKKNILFVSNKKINGISFILENKFGEEKCSNHLTRSVASLQLFFSFLFTESDKKWYRLIFLTFFSFFLATVLHPISLPYILTCLLLPCLQ